MDRMSRRDFLRVSALLSAGTLAAACTQPAPQAEPAAAPAQPEPAAPAQPAAPTQPERIYSEAPVLAERVASGDLPPVEERLPENPFICPVLESIGKYGGTWRSAFKGLADGPAVTSVKQRGPLNFTGDILLQPDICEAWDVSDDARVWTFHMRKGMKWSDGHPLTTADVKWYWDHQVNNPELSLVIPTRWSTEQGGKRTLAELDIADDFTFSLTFALPKVLFGYDLVWLGGIWTPGHYMEQFHAGFTPKAELDAKVAEAGLGSWVDLFNDRNTNHLNPERPCLDVWVAKNSLSGDMFVMERNPFFHHVDPEGQQLPYIDEVRLDLVENNEVINLKAIQGEIDMQTRGLDINKYSLFKENEAEHDYRTFLWEPGAGSHLVFFFNQSYSSDPLLQEIFQNKDFRVARSMAIDRATINEVTYLGLAEARSELVVQGSAYYQEDIKTLYTEYDPAKAEEILDGLGLTKGADGWRVRPDGKPLEILIETQNTGSGLDPIQIATENWQAIGVKADFKTMERSLYWTRATGNEVKVATWGTDRGLEPFVDPIYVFPLTNVPGWAPPTASGTRARVPRAKSPRARQAGHGPVRHVQRDSGPGRADQDRQGDHPLHGRVGLGGQHGRRLTIALRGQEQLPQRARKVRCRRGSLCLLATWIPCHFFFKQ